jgi:hypothetical protein
MSGIESGGWAGIWIAYAAIVAFVLLLLVILARTAALYSLLLILPLGRLLRWIPGMPRLLNRLERKRASDQHA